MLLLGRLVNTFSYTRMFNLLIINQRLDFRISKRKVKNCVKNIRGPINVLPSETNVIAFPVKNMQDLMIIGLHCILYFFFFFILFKIAASSIGGGKRQYPLFPYDILRRPFPERRTVPVLCIIMRFAQRRKRSQRFYLLPRITWIFRFLVTQAKNSKCKCDGFPRG